MTDQSGKATKGSREERLKQALRENLKRRKAQNRERSQAAAEQARPGEATGDAADESKR
ncbi:conserved hypothetical protein [Bradyrhizobium sp. ORS 375]|uniref:hypothetical protein n=1 Tax=Bradyrhizobium sp. (strain ORS 375) TaxID=566679 RepID=UPI0002406F1D|nr:hypothetical protein [Bradyrhizobium sp. ORS 375]CCD94706.1 conserved hypothetical protein [Bradyrhizobium sp. ORS 375]